MNHSSFCILERKIGKNYPIYVIAEIGINHNGNKDIAQQMIQAAAECGVDALKFQIVNAQRCYSKNSESYAIFKKMEFSLDIWQELIEYARSLNIHVFATFANPEDLKDHLGLEMPVFKISSTSITNFPLLKEIAKYNKPVIMSTGMSYLSEVDEAVRFLKKHGQQQIAILQCTSLYPTLAKDANLNAIRTLQTAFTDCPIGFSDHTMGNECAIAAIALGASIIEKHFTLDKKMPGHDHHFSATPQEIKALVKSIRYIEKALGNGVKAPVEAELKFRGKLQRSLVAAQDLNAGEVLTENKIAVKRSSVKGLESKLLEMVLGRKIKIALAQDEPITLDVI